MLQKLKLLFKKGKSASAFVNKKQEQQADHPEFRDLIHTLNQYFDARPSEKEQYREELHFLNSEFEPLPEVDKIFYAVIPYKFVLEADYRSVMVQKDFASGLNYVYLDNKQLFYHRGYTETIDIQKSFTFLSIEQHPDSPHRYLDNNFLPGEDDVVADFGAAEGNFSLMIVEKVKKLIIVEADPLWIEALQKTFEPWKHKVVIINKFLGTTNDADTITLDALATEHQLTALKMDIEGAEIAVLHASHDYLSTSKIKMAITTYHRQTDADDITTILKSHDYACRFSEGFMIFINDKQSPPFFRKGLVKTAPGFSREVI